MKKWKRLFLGCTVILATALTTGCGSSDSAGGLGGFGPNSGVNFPQSGSGGPGTGIPVPFSPGTNLVSLNLTPSSLQLYRGQDQPLTIQGVNANGSIVSITPGPGVTITTSTPGLISISPTGVITPLARGEGTITVAVTTPQGTVSQTFPYSVRRRLFVTHFGDDTLRVFDAETYAPLKTINLGGHPLAMLAHQATDKLWVGAGNGNGLRVFDLANLDLAPTVVSDPDPLYGYNSALFNPYNNTMLWAHVLLTGTTTSLEGYDATSLAQLTSSPFPATSLRTLARNDTGTQLYSTTLDVLGTGVQIRDPDTLAVVDFVMTQQSFNDRPRGLVFDPANQCVYVGSAELATPPFASNIITVNVTGTPAITAVTPLPTANAGPVAIAGNRVFMSHFNSPSVSVLRTTSVGAPLVFEQTLTTGMNPSIITIDRDLNRLLVSVEGTNSLAVFDLTTLDPIAGSPFPMGMGPNTCEFEP